MISCLDCGGALGEWDVPCDGCHRFIHKNCTNGYLLVDTEYAGRVALLFCQGCEREHYDAMEADSGL